jgi:hypothetical protein
MRYVATLILEGLHFRTRAGQFSGRALAASKVPIAEALNAERYTIGGHSTHRTVAHCSQLVTLWCSDSGQSCPEC